MSYYQANFKSSETLDRFVASGALVPITIDYEAGIKHLEWMQGLRLTTGAMAEVVSVLLNLADDDPLPAAMKGDT